MKKYAVLITVVMMAVSVGAKDLYVNVDFCDQMIHHYSLFGRGYTAADVTNLLRRCKASGANGINWRVAPLGVASHPSKTLGDIDYAEAKGRYAPELVKRLRKDEPIGWLSPNLLACYRATKKLLPDSLAVAVAVCRSEGLKINFWIDLHDEYFGKFTTEHPECLVRTPEGTTMPGVRDYGNETAVRAKLDELEELFRYRPDGFYFCPSSHTRHLKFEEPDGAFGTLPAEKFTAFLRRCKTSFRPHGFTLTMGVACKALYFCSPYFSEHVKYTIEHDWRTWVEEGIADALVVADYERLREFDGVWYVKGVKKAGGIDPADVFLQEFLDVAKGKVPLYYFSGWLTHETMEKVLRRGTSDVLAFGLDGMFVHEAMMLESIGGGFDALAEVRKRFDSTENR